MINVSISMTGIGILLSHGAAMKQMVFPAARTPTNGVLTGNAIPAHLTYILVAKASYDGGRAPDFELGNLYYFFLAGETVTPDLKSEPFVTSLAEIPEMPQLLGPSAKIKADYRAGEDPRLVSARVLLQGGKLVTSDPRPFQTEFDDLNTGKPVKTMQTARFLVNQSTIEQGPFRLALKPFGGGPPDEIRVNPVNGAVSVVIANTPESEILPDSVEAVVDVYDRDFELFYRAYELPLKDPVMPKAVKPPVRMQRVRLSVMGVGGADCSPVAGDP